MKLWIELNTKPGEPDKKAQLKMPAEDVLAVEVPGVKCQCGAEPLFVSGCGKRIHNHDTYRADAVCPKCDGHVGVLYLQVSTLFGLEEDERVFSMGVRIY